MTTAKRASSRRANTKVSTSQSSTRRAKMLTISSLRGEPASEPAADIRSATLDEIKDMDKRGELHATRPGAEEIELDDWFWRNAALVMPSDRPKASVHLRVDPDVFDWFKRQGKGHLTRMNAVLRAYYEANRKKAS
jgi:uncharacterized protein (DUF4415 family)